MKKIIFILFCVTQYINAQDTIVNALGFEMERATVVGFENHISLGVNYQHFLSKRFNLQTGLKLHVNNYEDDESLNNSILTTYVAKPSVDLYLATNYIIPFKKNMLNGIYIMPSFGTVWQKTTLQYNKIIDFDVIDPDIPNRTLKTNTIYFNIRAGLQFDLHIALAKIYAGYSSNDFSAVMRQHLANSYDATKGALYVGIQFDIVKRK